MLCEQERFKEAASVYQDALKYRSFDFERLIKIINENIYYKGLDFFDQSITKLIQYIKTKSEYPEAYFLIAKIYEVEGEYWFPILTSKQLNENIRNYLRIQSLP